MAITTCRFLWFRKANFYYAVVFSLAVLHVGLAFFLEKILAIFPRGHQAFLVLNLRPVADLGGGGDGEDASPPPA